MRFGVCTQIEQAHTVYAAGYDFIECMVVSLKAEESDAAVRDLMSQFRESPVPVEAFNVLLPGDMKIVGDHVDENRIQRYLSKALERVKMVGGETVVFGSGKARMLPDSFPRAKGEEQIIRFLERLADIADPLDITIAIEPLNTTECNIINSVPEAAQFAQQLNRKSIRVLADFYHMHKEDEPLEHMVAHQDFLHHVHISDSRYAPGMGDYPYDSFVDCIRRANYDGRISIECLWKNFEEDIAIAKTFVEQKFRSQESIR